ncbi:hypothetical protein K502DRAFT_153526 [Neoconidiobolus thromboides FSU 785]|nr:hypothetical protein K502DRAFT_153526 [Neoconidiobolus thromboides FSU 785]
MSKLNKNSHNLWLNEIIHRFHALESYWLEFNRVYNFYQIVIAFNFIKDVFHNMGAYYKIFGQKIASEYLVFGTWAALGFGIYSAKGGSSKTDNKLPEPKINASSNEEEAFIQEFLKAAENDSTPAKH